MPCLVLRPHAIRNIVRQSYRDTYYFQFVSQYTCIAIIPPTTNLLHVGQLTGRSGCAGKSIKCCINNNCEAVSAIEHMNDVHHLVFHVGVNNLKSSPVEDTFKQYDCMIELARTKAENITVSLLTPCDSQPVCSIKFSHCHRMQTPTIVVI